MCEMVIPLLLFQTRTSLSFTFHRNSKVRQLCKNLINYRVSSSFRQTPCININPFRLYNTSSKNTDFYHDLYQKCSGIGWIPSATSNQRHPFGSYLTSEFSYRMCFELFGIDQCTIDEAERDLNRRNGGPFPRLNNVIFINGEYSLLRDLLYHRPNGNGIHVITLKGMCMGCYGQYRWK